MQIEEHNTFFIFLTLNYYVMRKKLFLTLALVLASFACATAQNWSVTLGSAEGLPGEQVTLDGVSVTYYKSGIIKANKPIRTLRFAVADTRNGQKPSGNNVTFALSELNVYTADMSKELSYTAKSNADHNTLTKSFDGQGLRALNDGSYNNFFHSMWAESGAVADYHYVELTFEESIERFVIEWGGRPSNHNNNPTVVVLTEGGVTAEPYTDRSSSFSEEKITSIAELAAAKYFTIRGNAPTSYHTYNNSTGEQTSKEPEEGSGPMYVTLGDTYAEAPTIDYLTQLVAAGNGKYYIYFPMQEKYLNADMSDNAYNDKHNGWQYATNDIDKAAKVTLTPLSNGDFEMSYDTKYNNENITVYVAADPRTGKMKTFSPTNKAALEANGWCQGFGLVCTFNWSFCKADYQAPAWAKEYELGYIYMDVKNLYDAVQGHEAAADVALAQYYAEIESAMASNMGEDEIKEFIETMKENVGDCVLEIAEAEGDIMEDAWDDYVTNTGTGKTYTEAAYKKYIEAGVALIDEITDADEYYSYINALADYFANKNSNLEAFLASAGAVAKLPMEFDNLQNTNLEQELNVSISNPVNGFRWTLMATHSNNMSAGYPFTSCAELEVIDNKSGSKIALDAALISSNSIQGGEGSIAGLVDGYKTADGYTGEQYGWYWHSIWNGTANTPNGEVYLDVQFPSGVALNDFTIKFTSRNGQLHNAPKTVIISEYGREHDFGGEVNPFNVKIGAQITDPSQLVDGGLYVIQGNLNVKKAEEPEEPRYYSGTTPFSTDAEIAADAPCVYMFKKAANGWKILSLAKGQYWVEDPAYGTSNLTVYQGKAGDLKIAKSNNIQNAMLIFRDIEPTTEKGSFSDADAGVEIPETDITVSKLVYMDWAGGLAARACYSEIPGETAPGCDALADEYKVTSAAGDYLHFNKTNGEGEWNIYKATMNDQYYVYLKGLVEEIDNLNLVTGMNPGCIAADAATTQQFENAKAAAIVAVENENKANAQNVLTTLTNAIEKFSNSERVGFDADAVYRIDCADERFMKESWYTRSIYSGASELAWTVTPDSYDGENYDFLFRIYEVNDEVAAQHRVTVPENEAGKAYIFQNVGNAAYIGSDWGYSAARGAIKVIEEIGTCAYNIKQTATGSMWHANGHQSGKAWEGNMVYYGGGLNSPSSWTFVYIGSADDYTLGIENVVEGDEVVSVNYFTPAGMAIAEPVKGINIVVTVYANGVVEAKKVLVK